MTTKKTKEYSQGKIYKIEPMGDFDEGDIYIGLTTQRLLSQRMGKHRNNYGCWKNGKGKKTTSFELFDKYGIDNCQILLLEIVNISNLDELKSREAYYIRALKCVNKNIPLRTNEEFKAETQYCKDYYEANKKAILEKSRENYEANKEAILERQHRNRLKKKQEKQANLNNTVVVNFII